MNHLRQTFMQNFFSAAAAYAVRREMRAPQSEKQFWAGQTESNLAASKLGDSRATELILRLRKTHCENPAFVNLCKTLPTL
jgi:hypothetical protein